MADYKSYSDKLKDPRWQKKRLQIFERDEWKCRYCFESKLMLAVHHKVYINGLEPWEYEDDLLITLCSYCHEEIREKIPIAVQNLIRALSQKDYRHVDIQSLAQAIIDNGTMTKGMGIIGPLLSTNTISDENWNTHTHPSLQPIIGLK